MYHAVVRRQARAVFERLSAGEWRSTLSNLADDVHHVFPGDHPLGGERHSRAAVARWFERLDRLFPRHEFEVERVVSRGWPGNTWVAVQWIARLEPQVGEPYRNHGAHWINLRWGRVVAFHAYLDTQLVADACAHMAAHGVEEASAPPIVD
jgi:ketosteroid isomerase-like protein